MGFLRRRGSQSTSGGQRDEDLPVLSVEQAATLTGLVRDCLAEQGWEGVADSGAVRLSDGRQFGLHNLAVSLAGQPYASWRPAVEAHLGTLLTATGDTPSGPVDPASIYVKLQREVDLPMPLQYAPLTPAEGIVGVVAVDYPDRVVECAAEDSVDLGMSIEDAFRTGLSNVRALPLPEHEVMGGTPDLPPVLHFYVTRDFFGPSRLLDIDRLLEQTLGHPVPPQGVFFAIPDRRSLVVHVPVDDNLFVAAQLMLQVAQQRRQTGAGGLSPDVFHLSSDGVGTRFSRRTPDGETSLVVSGPITEAMTRLGLLER